MSVAFEWLCHVAHNLFQIDTQLISTAEVNFEQELAYVATNKRNVLLDSSLKRFVKSKMLKFGGGTVTILWGKNKAAVYLIPVRLVG